MWYNATLAMGEKIAVSTSCEFSLFDFVLCLGEVVDLVSDKLFEHHLKVAYIAFRLGEAMGLSEESLEVILLGGLLHDFGAFSLRERLNALYFEFDNPMYHALVAYALFKKFTMFGSVAEIIRFHHMPWEDGKGREVPIESHIIHFADRLSIVCALKEDPIGEVEEKASFMGDFVPRLFHPEIFNAFRALLKREYIWLDIASRHLRDVIKQLIPVGRRCLDVESFLEFSQFVSYLIDFRSPFTATHSAGVASVAYVLGGLSGLPLSRQTLLRAAGLLHDLGKVAIPAEILEKPESLSPKEMRIMRSHAYYTFGVLSQVRSFRDIALWSADHHERCNGQGYPFGKREEELLFESRIMAVADVFAALVEDRPYRVALSPVRVRGILENMALSGELDKNLVELLLDNFEEVYHACKEAQREAASTYRAFREELAHIP